MSEPENVIVSSFRFIAAWGAAALRAAPALLSVMICAAYLTSCAHGSLRSAYGEHYWTQPGVLRVLLFSEPKSLNPIFYVSELFVDNLVFDPLVTVDSNGDDIPILAQRVPTIKNGDISRDGLRITYHLRRNVRWHDGAPFTADDVKYTWQQVMNPNNNVPSRRGYDDITSVDVPDSYTVVFHLRQRFAPFVDTVFGESELPYAILPKHLLEKYSNLNQVPFNANPIGTGPFKFVKWARGDYIEFVANDSYFLGKPKLRRIIAKIVADGNTRVTLMRTHEADLDPQEEGPVFHQVGPAMDLVRFINEWPEFEGVAFNLARAPLSDIQVRRALAYATDPAAIMRTTQFGLATLATEDIPTYSWAYSPDVTRYEYAPKRAMELLDSDGWRVGPDGIRRKNGKQLGLTMVIMQGDPDSQRGGLLLQEFYRQIGVDIQLKSYTFGQVDGVPDGIKQMGKFDLLYFEWIAGADPDDASLFTCQNVEPKGLNVPRFCDPAFDTVENEAMSHYDRATRKIAYARAQKILSDRIPVIFLFYPKEMSILSPDLRGFHSNGISDSWNAYTWSI